MKIIIASKNNIKIDAVKETIKDYPLFKNTEITSISVESGVPNQPKTINDTIQGAINKAKNVRYNTTCSTTLYALVAQRIEQFPSKEKVGGSIPSRRTSILFDIILKTWASGGMVDTRDLKSRVL